MSERPPAQADTGERTWRGRLIGAAIVVGVLLLFVALNSGEVEIDIIVASPDMRLGWALLLAGGLGFLGGLLFPRLRRKHSD